MMKVPSAAIQNHIERITNTNRESATKTITQISPYHCYVTVTTNEQLLYAIAVWWIALHASGRQQHARTATPTEYPQQQSATHERREKNNYIYKIYLVSLASTATQKSYSCINRSCGDSKNVSTIRFGTNAFRSFQMQYIDSNETKTLFVYFDTDFSAQSFLFEIILCVFAFFSCNFLDQSGVLHSKMRSIMTDVGFFSTIILTLLIFCN